jgi:histidyl-tRNA synthetase
MSEAATGGVKIRPRLFKGTRDLLPQDMLPRQRVLDIVRKHAERAGFEPLMTPSIELLEVLTGKYGQEAQHLIFPLAYKDGQTAALRYDLTVPLSRVVAMYPNLPRPFKRYQVQPVWRAEKPAKGRYREFVQCDVDTVGTADMAADAEILAFTASVLTECGFPRFLMRVNHRKILDGVLDSLQVDPEQRVFVLRTVDKLDKIGEDGVRKVLETGGVSGDGGEARAEASGLDATQAKGVLDAARLCGRPDEVAPAVERLFGNAARTREGLDELRELFAVMEAMLVPAACYAFDMSLVRGLDYYTGPVFETVVPDIKLGSIAGGGRYDGLVGLFSSEDVPATGTTLGLDRIVVAMQELGILPGASTSTCILIAVFSPELRLDAFSLTAMLRQCGVAAEASLEALTLKKQYSYANKKGIPYVGLVGPDERDRGVVSVKNLSSGEQTEVPRQDLAHWIQSRTGEVSG